MPSSSKSHAPAKAPRPDGNAQRLLNLFFVLNSSAEPLSTEQIVMDSDLGYGGGNPESDKKKFQRDRKDLADLGVFVSEVRPEGAKKTEESSWTIDRERTFAAGGLITAEDAELLAAAIEQTLTGTDSPFAVPLESIHDKLSRLCCGEVSPAASARISGSADAVWSAFAARTPLKITYKNARGEKSERTVCVYGVFDKDGHSYLCGLDGASSTIRTFRIDRIAKAKRGAKHYEIPADFCLREKMFLPFDFSENDPVEAVFSLPAACSAEQAAAITLGRGKVKGAASGLEWTVEVRDIPAAASFCLEHAAEGLVPKAPQALVDAWRADIERTVAAHA